MSENPKHTPGPLGVAIWNDGKTDPVEQFRAHLSFGGGRIWGVWAPEHPLTVGSYPNPQHAVMTCLTGNGPASEANAYLYAAAPDLLAALKLAREALVEIEEREDDVFAGMEEIDAAIAKAEGRS